MFIIRKLRFLNYGFALSLVFFSSCAETEYSDKDNLPLNGAVKSDNFNPVDLYIANIKAGEYEIMPGGKKESRIGLQIDVGSSVANTSIEYDTINGGNNQQTLSPLFESGPQKLGDVDEIWINIKEIDFVSDETGITTIPANVTRVDLLKLKDDATILFGGSVPSGTFGQIRLILEKNNGGVVADGVEYSLKVPSGSQTGVKLTGGIELLSGLVTNLILDFQIESLKFTRGEGFILSPTIGIEHAKSSLPFIHGMLMFQFTEVVNASVGSDGIVQTGIAELDGLFRKYGVLALERLTTGFDNLNQEKLSKFGVDRIYIASFKSRTDVIQAMFEFSGSEFVEHVEPNQIIHSSATYPSDPHADPFSLEIIGREQALYLNAINAYNGWDNNTGSPDNKIAVIDTGVDDSHYDLAGRVEQARAFFVRPCTKIYCWDGTCVIDQTVCTHSRPTSEPVNTSDHGTHVAGIIGAAQNGMGTVGIDWNSMLISINTFQLDGEGIDCGINPECTSHYAVHAGILEAVNRGAKVINMSLGGNGFRYCNLLGCHHTHHIEHKAIGFAYASEVTMVAAAGNDNEEVSSYPGTSVFPGHYPSSFNEVISVAALHEDGSNRAPFSNFGKVDVAAPGVSIHSTVFNNGHEDKYGTSMAAPIVAGFAGLLLSENSKLHPETVREIMCSTADPISAELGCGRINIGNALPAVRPDFDTCLPRCASRWFNRFSVQYEAQGGIPPYNWYTESIPSEGGWGQFYHSPHTNDTEFQTTGNFYVPANDGGCIFCSFHYNVCVQDSVGTTTCHRTKFSWGL